MFRKAALLALLAFASLAAVAVANHIPGQPCNDCADHNAWPTIHGKVQKAPESGGTLTGTDLSDQLMGHHGSDIIRAGAKSDVLWGDWDGVGQPTSQRDRIYGNGGNDFIYGSHGRNVIFGGKGNDAISVHYGRGYVDCGPGRDIYHVAKTRKAGYKFRNCEKVDYRSERQRGGGLRPLP
jgi:Ca2+-binding RTX toxin-like protein